ncbi:MAG: TolC family protein [Enterocloster asparagiformis]|nr:TolC family protein [Enterocloster asparagiformis]
MKYKKTAGFLLAAVMCQALAPVRAYAGSPEFAYTAEKWASLRDNTLEYDEIADLIHEYNNTVIQNQIEYADYRGEDRDDISDDYYEAAQDILNSLDYPDADSSNYASGLSSYLSGQIQADNLTEQGDDNVDDGYTKKLGYDKEEAQLVKEAQGLMISYWSQAKTLESLEKAEELAKTSCQSVETKLSAGLSTQAEVLSAREAVTSAEASLLSAQSALEKTKETLCLMLGWSYGAEVAIGDVPEPDLEAVAAIDLEADVEAGLAANYELRILERQISYARNQSNKASLEETYKSRKETAASDIKSGYRSLLLAKSDYEQALQAHATAQDSLSTAARRLQAGTITPKAYAAQESAAVTAQVNAQVKELALFQAQLEYQWAVNGLAAVT